MGRAYNGRTTELAEELIASLTPQSDVACDPSCPVATTRGFVDRRRCLAGSAPWVSMSDNSTTFAAVPFDLGDNLTWA